MLKKATIKKLIEPGAVGELVTYLCSDSAACITGFMLTINCGWMAAERSRLGTMFYFPLDCHHDMA